MKRKGRDRGWGDSERERRANTNMATYTQYDRIFVQLELDTSDTESL